MSPQRIQRKRTKGWRMPEGAVYVGRGSRWGNPFAVGGFYESRTWCHDYPVPLTAREADRSLFMSIMRNLSGQPVPIYCNPIRDAPQAVELYRRYVEYNDDVFDTEAFASIEGKDLACWCSPARSCHADVLLELANPVSTG